MIRLYTLAVFACFFTQALYANEIDPKQLALFILFVRQYQEDIQSGTNPSPFAELVAQNQELALGILQTANSSIQTEVGVAFRAAIARRLETNPKLDIKNKEPRFYNSEEINSAFDFIQNDTYFKSYQEWESQFSGPASYDSEAIADAEYLLGSSHDFEKEFSLERFQSSLEETLKSIEGVSLEVIRLKKDTPHSEIRSPSPSYLEKARLELSIHVTGARSPALRFLNRFYEMQEGVSVRPVEAESVIDQASLYHFARGIILDLSAQQDLEGIQSSLRLSPPQNLAAELEKRLQMTGYSTNAKSIEALKAMAYILEQIDLKEMDLKRTYAIKLDANSNPIVLRKSIEVDEATNSQRAKIIEELKNLDRAYLILKNYENLSRQTSKEQGTESLSSNQKNSAPTVMDSQNFRNKSK